MNIAKGFKLEDKKVLLVMAGVDENVLLSVRNVPNALMAQAVDLNAFTLSTRMQSLLLKTALQF